MKYLKTFLLGLLAGIAIALGGLVYPAVSSSGGDPTLAKIGGGFLFSLGLMTICGFGLFLFTGKIGYVTDNSPEYLLHLLLGYLGNFVGALTIGYLCYAIPAIRDGAIGAVARGIASSRDVLSGGEPWYSALLLGFLCGFFVYIAVAIYKAKPGVIGLVGLMFAVASFTVMGAEHCIANMFYFSISNGWSGGTILNVLLVTVGNSGSAILFHVLLKFALPKKEGE